MRSVSVVLPESMCAEMPMLRMRSRGIRVAMVSWLRHLAIPGAEGKQILRSSTPAPIDAALIDAENRQSPRSPRDRHLALVFRHLPHERATERRPRRHDLYGPLFEPGAASVGGN